LSKIGEPPVVLTSGDLSYEWTRMITKKKREGVRRKKEKEG
jgi:hypothetical protein